MEMQSELIEVNVTELQPAPWNPKADGSDEKMEKLVNSIVEDGSYGVPAVRMMDDGKYEVMDGNHRLQAIIRLGLQRVRVESFGKITKAAAILIAHRRNAQWFEEDQLAMAQLLVNDVLPEYESIADIAAFMPESLVTLENMVDVLDGSLQLADQPPPPSDDQLTERVSFRVDPVTYSSWLAWKEECKSEGAERDVDAFAALLNAAQER